MIFGVLWFLRVVLWSLCVACCLVFGAESCSSIAVARYVLFVACHGVFVLC